MHPAYAEPQASNRRAPTNPIETILFVSRPTRKLRLMSGIRRSTEVHIADRPFGVITTCLLSWKCGRRTAFSLFILFDGKVPRRTSDIHLAAFIAAHASALPLAIFDFWQRNSALVYRHAVSPPRRRQALSIDQGALM